MSKKFLMLLALLTLCAGMAMAQRRVTGIVLDTDGIPVPGAAIRVDGTKIVTTSDDNGRFVIAGVPQTAKKVTVIYFGKQQATLSITEGELRVVLSDIHNALEEAMVVAYGTAKKSSFTGSAAQIKGEQIEAHVTSNVSNALNGQMAGVQSFNTTGQPGKGCFDSHPRHWFAGGFERAALRGGRRAL